LADATVSAFDACDDGRNENAAMKREANWHQAFTAARD
jgi:hypothetical protein